MSFLTPTRITVALIVSFFIVAAVFFNDDFERESDQRLEAMGCVSAETNRTPERLLASIESDDPCPDDLVVNRFRSILDHLERQCEESPKSYLGDMIVKTQKLLEGEGIEASLREIGSALDRATAGQTGQDCATALSLYVVQRSRTG